MSKTSLHNWDCRIKNYNKIVRYEAKKSTITLNPTRELHIHRWTWISSHVRKQSSINGAKRWQFSQPSEFLSRSGFRGASKKDNL